MQNSTKQDVTGPTRSFSDPLLRYSWSNSKDLAKNLAPDNEPSTGNLRGWLTVFMLLIAMTISSSFLTGCGDGSTTVIPDNNIEIVPPTDENGGKNLFSTWTSLDGEDVLYFGTMEFIQWQNIAIIDEPDICLCQLQLIGDQNAGSYTFRQCVLFAGDIGICNVLNSTGTYSKTVDELALQPASGPVQIYR